MDVVGTVAHLSSLIAAVMQTSLATLPFAGFYGSSLAAAPPTCGSGITGKQANQAT